MLPRSIPLKLFVPLVLVIGACAGEGVGESSPTTRLLPSTTEPIPVTTSTIPPVPTTTPITTTTQGLSLGQELVGNGDFSAAAPTGAPSGWELTALGEGQRVEYETEAGESLIRFLTPLTSTDGWPEATSQPFPVLPHTDYRLSAEGRTVTAGRLFLALVFLDEDGSRILMRGIGSPVVARSDWTRAEGTIESPASAASAFVVVGLPVLSETTDEDDLTLEVRKVSVQEVIGS